LRGDDRIIEAWVDVGILGQWIETCKSIGDFRLPIADWSLVFGLWSLEKRAAEEQYELKAEVRR
jgi:hypothetical protein